MAKSRIDTTLLENRIGYRFNERELLERALTHSSYSNESGLKNHHMLCNEWLEFLGDSVLSIIIRQTVHLHLYLRQTAR